MPDLGDVATRARLSAAKAVLRLAERWKLFGAQASVSPRTWARMKKAEHGAARRRRRSDKRRLEAETACLPDLVAGSPGGHARKAGR